ncbi:hypothetical protein [Polaribacter sp.]|uniref:hypothetical protein n=1 Tax=Polaribacter sp. TaxID=1920175 RepID=UPI003F6BC5CB
MDYHDEKKKFEDKYENSLIKYSYYLIGLNITALGYTVSITKNLIINELTTLLLFACIFWLLSTLIGLLFLRLKISAKYYSSLFYSSLFQLKKESNEMSRTIYKDKVTEIRAEHEKKTSPLSKKMVIYYNLIHMLFFVGVLFFMAWHILIILKSNQ